MDRILAIDSGLTVTKAVIFDLEGQEIAVARTVVPQLLPAPHHIERDMRNLWQLTSQATQQVLTQSNTDPARILAVGCTAHGDGLYLLDHSGAPLGPGILSLDSRATREIDDWQTRGIDQQVLALTGQVPHVSAPVALLAWIKREQPERFARIAHVLSCKDWLCYCLSGRIGTDRTEASASFTNVHSQDYCVDTLSLYELSMLTPALPEIAHSANVVGAITTEAAKNTGLCEGVPVIAGLHDVTASALGMGAHAAGVMGIVAGTYSINEIVAPEPAVDERWFCRSAIEPQSWNHMAISPASTTNYDWFLDTLCAGERASSGQDVHAMLYPEIDAALCRSSSVFYHPYLYGSPMGASPSAGFLGLRGWHDRGDMLAAVLQGIVFNHRHHIDALREQFTVSTARLTGGASRNPLVAQLFADILNTSVTVVDVDEAAARGVALCAGAATGAWSSYDEDPVDLQSQASVYEPNPERAALYERRYALYRKIGNSLTGVWEELNALTASKSEDNNRDD